MAAASFRIAFFFIVFFCLYISFAFATNLEQELVLENEYKAVELGKIWKLEAIQQAITLFERTAGDWEKLAEPQRAVFCLNETAKLAQIISDYEIATRALQKAVELETSHSLIEDKIISLSLFSLLSDQKGDKRNTRKYSDEAMTLSHQVLSAKAKAYALFSAGMYEYYHGKIKDATSFFEQSGNFAQQTQDIVLMSQALFYVGYSYLRDGSPYRARDKMNLALQLCEQFEYKRGVALSYFGIAFVHYFLNEKQKALDLFRKSASLFPPNFEWTEKARNLDAIGVIYLDFGDLEMSESNFRQSLPYYEKAGYPPGKLGALIYLADISVLQSDLERARQTYELATKLCIELGDRFQLATIKEGIGGIEFREGNYDAAIKNYLEALRTYNETGVRFASSDNLLGKAYGKKGKYEMARRYYSSAMRTNRPTKDFIQLSENLYNIAELDLLQNNPDNALKNIKESVNVTDDLYAGVTNDHLKRSHFSNIYDRYELYIHLLMQKHKQSPIGGFDIQALQASEKARSRSLLETLRLSEASFTRDANSESVEREKELLTVLDINKTTLTDLLSGGGESEEIEKIEDEIRNSQQKLEEIRVELKRNSPIYSATKNPEPFDVADFQANVLGEDNLLLEFSLGKEESYLWAVDKTSVTAYYLPPRGAIEARVDKLRSLLGGRQLKEGETLEEYQMRIADAKVEYKAEARNLSNDLLGQAKDKLAGKKLIVVADGRLHYFPLGSLPMPGADDDDPILLTNEVVYTPSASTLKILRMKKNTETRPQKDLLVFADPVFSKSDERIAGLDTSNQGLVSMILPMFRSIESLESMPRLPASEEEAKSISEVVGANQTTVRAGFAANRDGVLNGGIEDYKILHFATHGLIHEERPELSGILLSLYTDEHKTNDGGFIRLQDIYGMKLNSDLVVLSACDTGIGKEIKGEGVMSLNNAFLQAGAKSVVSSLWKVDDTATKDLMTEFYRGMADDNLTAAAALRGAQIKMYNDPRYRSPFYWAAFTASGDTGVRVAFTSYAWLYALIATALIAVAVIAFLAFRGNSRRHNLQKPARQ